MVANTTPITANTAPANQKRLTTGLFCPSRQFKMMMNRAHLNTRTPRVLKEITWIITDNASITKMPPITTSNNSVFS